jgi:sRNA-binding protein
MMEPKRITGTLRLKVGPLPRSPAPPPALPRRTFVLGLLKTFAATWPAVFDKTEVKPLRIGVSAEIEEALTGKASKRLVRDAIGYWTNGNNYLRALAQPGAMRHGLDGALAEPVAPEHREHAIKRLAERGWTADGTAPPDRAKSPSDLNDLQGG